MLIYHLFLGLKILVYNIWINQISGRQKLESAFIVF